MGNGMICEQYDTDVAAGLNRENFMRLCGAFLPEERYKKTFLELQMQTQCSRQMSFVMANSVSSPMPLGAEANNTEEEDSWEIERLEREIKEVEEIEAAMAKGETVSEADIQRASGKFGLLIDLNKLRTSRAA